MAAVVCVYAGLVLLSLGLVSLLRPLRFLGISSRRRAALVLVSGPLLVAIGGSLPAREVRIDSPRSRLDEFAPVYQFSERHALHVNAAPDRVFRATRAVTADEILLFRTLTWIRRFGRPGPESIMAAPEHVPLIDVATRTSFLLLAEERDREIVIGTLVIAPAGFRARERPTPEDLKRLEEPGFAKVAMNFRIEPDGRGGSDLSTETRVFATDPTSRRQFAAYWRVIYPGSALIRHMWLRAIRLRAEGSPPSTTSGASGSESENEPEAVGYRREAPAGQRTDALQEVGPENFLHVVDVGDRGLR